MQHPLPKMGVGVFPQGLVSAVPAERQEGCWEHGHWDFWGVGEQCLSQHELCSTQSDLGNKPLEMMVNPSVGQTRCNWLPSSGQWPGGCWSQGPALLVVAPLSQVSAQARDCQLFYKSPSATFPRLSSFFQCRMESPFQPWHEIQFLFLCQPPL